MTMPALFIGHGSPMNAIEDNEFSRGWRSLAAAMPQPRAILCISAHWETRGVFVTTHPQPETIHDFYGFPQALFDVRYPAFGDPALAQRIVELTGAKLDAQRGFDHGVWGVLRPMWPDAGIPVVQLSLDTSRPGRWHYELAQKLKPLRDEGVLILASGNGVHNLRVMDFHAGTGFPWATRINERIKQCLSSRDHAALMDWQTLDPDIRLAIPTPEHYLPLLYALGVQAEREPLSVFSDRVVMGSIAMTGVKVG